MNAATINAIYSDYLNDKEALLDQLLEAVCSVAVAVTHDEDVAQNITVEVWKELPTLTITASFASYLHRKIKWRHTDAQRRDVFNPLNQFVSAEEAENRLIEASMIEAETTDNAAFNAIKNPFVKEVARLLMEGYTRGEIAKKLNVDRDLRTMLREALEPTLNGYRSADDAMTKTIVERLNQRPTGTTLIPLPKRFFKRDEYGVLTLIREYHSQAEQQYCHDNEDWLMRFAPLQNYGSLEVRPVLPEFLLSERYKTAFILTPKQETIFQYIPTGVK